VVNEDEFSRQCQEVGEKITDVLFGAPKAVAVCVLPAVLAAVMRTLDIPRETIIAMLDSALEDIDAG